MTVVLDSWAIMRLLEGDEPAASRVEEQLTAGQATMNWVNLGEVFYILRRMAGEQDSLRTIQDLEVRITTIVPDRGLTLAAARIKSEHPMSYADCFAAATALQLSAPLWTGDPELKVSDASWQVHDPSIAETGA